MPALFLPIIIATVNLMLLTFLGYYLWTLKREKKLLEGWEKELTQKENKIDTDYHTTINDTLSKEHKILEEATKEASSIINNSQYVNNTAKEIIEKALQQMVMDIKNKADASSNDCLASYKNSLTQLSGQSLNDFQNITKKFEVDMQSQMQNFRDSLLPQMQKELDAYKQQRFSEADKTINKIIQDIAQKVLNKSLSLEDHQNLIIESLEKSRKEGVFE